MDVLGNLVGGQACAADGTTAARNPISRLVDSLMEGSAGGQQKGRTRRTFNPQQHGGGGAHGGVMMMHGHPGVAAAAAESAAAYAHAQGMGLPSPPAMMGTPSASSHHPQAHPYADDWANEFGNHGPPPPNQSFHGAFEGAWGAHHPHPPPHGAMMSGASGGVAWANEFQHGPPNHAMMPMPHPAEMEMAWAARGGGNGEYEMMRGRTMPPSGAGGAIGGPAMQRGPVLGAHEQVAINVGQREVEIAPSSDKEEAAVAASARALAGEMASDPDGCFGESELFRFARSLGDGKLVVSGDKVVSRPGAGFDEAWAGEVQGGVGVRAAEGLDTAWSEGTTAANVSESQSFSDTWAGLDSGVGVRDEPVLTQSTHNQAWAESALPEGLALDPETALQQSMEAAWQEAKAGGAGVSGVDPDLQAVWDAQDEGVETLDSVWSRTAARLEAGGTGSKEAPYVLNQDNRFSDISNPFEEGMRLFEEGQIADAALCFEAEIARNPENSQAWFMLGQSHAENDQDRLAISCLERAVEMDPYSLDALLALGTSYVNELDSERALHNLKAWVQHNPKYSGLEIAVDEYSDGTLMDEVMQLMLQAQRWDATDADAHVVLGVLYNVSRDYDSAAEAFRRALEARPNDHSLWNKLGATLANHRRSEEALPAYRRAIASKPGYARAWLNMGISQANLNRYEEASSCYLQALRLNPEAKHIWSYLRIVFTSMERFDLVQKAGEENAKLFEEDFALGLPTPP